jgi:uncharacterized protein with von Willebrand factor type A (vWA) domain
MLISFFQVLKRAGVPVSIKELLDLLLALKNDLAFANIDDFYHLSRTIMVKDEKYFDKFDRAFGAYFKDLETLEDVIESMIPEDWFRHEFTKQLSEEDKAKIESLGLKSGLKSKRNGTKVATSGLALVVPRHSDIAGITQRVCVSEARVKTRKQ